MLLLSTASYSHASKRVCITFIYPSTYTTTQQGKVCWFWCLIWYSPGWERLSFQSEKCWDSEWWREQSDFGQHKGVCINCLWWVFKTSCCVCKVKTNSGWTSQLTDARNSCQYTCASSLFPPTSPLHNTMVVRLNITCESPIESQYHSAILVHFPPICHWYGGQEETLVLDEYYNLQAHYQTIRAICFFCKAQGKSPSTRHPLNSAKRPRKVNNLFYDVVFISSCLYKQNTYYIRGN